jgi:hypothetical protein
VGEGGGGVGGREWVGAGREMTQALYAHMNNKKKYSTQKRAGGMAQVIESLASVRP